MIFPGKTIGILGGGQLGRMIILEGRKMGYRFLVLDPSPDCPAGQVADEQVIASYEDVEAAKQFADKAQLILYEFENIDPNLVRHLESVTRVPQGSRLLEVTRNRLSEKQTLEQSGIPVTPYFVIRQKSDVWEGWSQFDSPAVLKTTTGGYDGKGQWLIQSQQDIENLSDEMFSSSMTYILEQFVPFEKELSVIVARSTTGEVKVFPPTLNLHRNHILHMSIAPVPIDPAIEESVKNLGQQVAEALHVTGLIAVEMFLLPDGQLLVNETAPRPHNSGHYTYDACTTSQFAQIVRAAVGLPLASTQMDQEAAIMVNVLGEHQEEFLKSFSSLPPHANVHWYGKHEAKKGRKMGHITWIGASISQLVDEIEQTSIWEQLTKPEKEVIFGERKSLKK